MPCSGCKHAATRRISPQRRHEIERVKPEELIAPKSENDAKVHLRYYGGGVTKKTSGCMSCGTQGSYALTTSETIQFPSDDAPMGWFSHFFQVGVDEYVTEKQAEYLLKLTFTNAAGQVIPKFKVIE